MPNQSKAVLKHILERKNGLEDNRKIGLIVEGGGMRGVFGGGAMIGLEELGLSDCFDYVYGSSSGCCSGAYLLSHQAKLGTSIYFEDLNGFKFIKPWQFSKMMDLDYMCDIVMTNVKKLNMKKLKNSKTVLKIFLSDSDGGKCEYFTNHDEVNILSAIKASCAFPGFYYPPVKINGSEYLDGNIGKALPIENAISDGCTDLLIVTTVPNYYRRPNRKKVYSFLMHIMLLPLDKNYKRRFFSRHDNYNHSLDVAFGTKPIHRRINVYTISPDLLVSHSETRRNRLKLFAEHGTNKIIEAFGGAK